MAAGRDGGVLRKGSGGGCREGAAGGCAADAVLPPADEPVGDVDVVAAVDAGGVFLEYVRYGYGQSLYGGELFGGELGFAAGGEPDVLEHDGRGDDGGLFGLDEGHGFSFVSGDGEQVLAEEALGELPAGR